MGTLTGRGHKKAGPATYADAVIHSSWGMAHFGLFALGAKGPFPTLAGIKEHRGVKIPKLM